MTHEPECAWAGQLNDDNCPTCNLISIGYKRGLEDAAKAVHRLHQPIDVTDWSNTVTICSCNGSERTISQGVITVHYYQYPCPTIKALDAVRGGKQK